MREIVKVLLQEGIDEETIHEVLDIIEEGVNLGRTVLKMAPKKDLTPSQTAKVHKKAMEVPQSTSSKEMSKKEIGDWQTDVRRGSDEDLLDVKRGEDRAKGYPKAIGRSIERHEKKNK